MNKRYHVENFPIDDKTLKLHETLFHNANGYLGVRGSWEEGVPEGYDTMRGTYLNGFFDVIPMKQSESLYGMMEEKDTMLNVADIQTVSLTVDGEIFDPFHGEVLHCERTLDMEQGITERLLRWRSPQGRELTVRYRRMASFPHKNIFTIEGEITCADGGTVEICSYHRGQVANYANPNDPRMAADGGVLLRPAGHASAKGVSYLLSRTLKSKLTVCTAVRHLFPGKPTLSYDAASHSYLARYSATLRPQETLRFTKLVAATDSRLCANPMAAAQDIVSQCPALDELYRQQREYLSDFWHNAELEIDADDDSSLAMAFNQYQLLQSCGGDGLSYVASKGLSGEGYEGHYFWDTEIYVLPFLTYTNPALARKLLRYRYATLPAARDHARIMGHSHGALYPWRTISGRECSGYFPSGSAQYHINGDVACAVMRYYLATLDRSYLVQEGAEILIETARLWLDVGTWNNRKFVIHDVTGPDEYTCIVNNNYYTNACARYNLRAAVKMSEILKGDDWDALAHRLDVSVAELSAFQKAAEGMYLPYDAQLDIHPQDDSFLQKPVWDFANTPKDHHPLLLHYHPLALYRHQVCKQADTILSYFLFYNGESLHAMRSSFAYYEKITTHDSSLSRCVFSIVASQLGLYDKAWEYFGESLRSDLQNSHGNTGDGIHTANMGGSYMMIVNGFAGVRITEDGLSLSPFVPDAWRGYRFRLRLWGSFVEIRATQQGCTICLLEGDGVTLSLYGKQYTIDRDHRICDAAAGGSPT